MNVTDSGRNCFILITLLTQNHFRIPPERTSSAKAQQPIQMCLLAVTSHQLDLILSVAEEASLLPVQS